MVKQKITDVVIELMKERNEIYVGYEGFGFLDDIYFECKDRGIIRGIGSNKGKSLDFPLNRQKAILNALDRDDRFEKHFMKCCGGRENGEARVRIFKLKLNSKSENK